MQLVEVKSVNLLVFNLFSQYEMFGFSSTIGGGISKGNYASFNLSPYSGDNPDNVSENQERIADVMGISIDDLYIPYQTHKDNIQVLDESFLHRTDLEKAKLLSGVDALITNQKHIAIGVTTADCVPVLIYDPKEHVLAAIHAGWKGTVARIVEKTVQKMTDVFGCVPRNMLAGIGPCISEKYFEVGEEVVEAFVQAGFTIDDVGSRNEVSGKMLIDLEYANLLLLNRSGIPINNIETASLCTYANPDLLFSARRQTINSGRMLTGGMLR